MFTTFSWIHVEVLLHGLVWTVLLSVISFVFGGMLGFVVSLAGIAKSKVLVGLVDAYIVLVQGTPVLILMFLVYFGLPIFGIEVSSLVAASVAMTIFSSAFLGAIWRGSLQSVSRTLGSVRLSCVDRITGALAGDRAASSADSNATNRRVYGANREEYFTRIDHRHG